MGKIRFCKWCASKFESKSNTQRFCSDRCRKDFVNYESKLHTQYIECMNVEEYDVMRAVETAERQSDICRKAKKMGLSYGKYMVYKSLHVKQRKRFMECNRGV